MGFLTKCFLAVVYEILIWTAHLDTSDMNTYYCICFSNLDFYIVSCFSTNRSYMFQTIVSNRLAMLISD